jgi:hypothetical protein
VVCACVGVDARNTWGVFVRAAQQPGCARGLQLSMFVTRGLQLSMFVTLSVLEPGLLEPKRVAPPSSGETRLGFVVWGRGARRVNLGGEARGGGWLARASAGR